MTITYLAQMMVTCANVAANGAQGCAVIPPNTMLRHPLMICQPTPCVPVVTTPDGVTDKWPEYCVENPFGTIGYIQLRFLKEGGLEVLMSPGIRPCATPVG